MQDHALNLPKKRNFGLHSDHILDKLIKEGFLPLSASTLASSLNEPALGFIPERINERVEEFLNKHQIFPESLSLTSLAKLLLRVTKKSAKKAQSLASAIHKLKGCSDHDIAKGLIKLIWFHLCKNSGDGKKAERKVRCWISRMNEMNIEKNESHALIPKTSEDIQRRDSVQRQAKLQSRANDERIEETVINEEHRNSFRLAETDIIEKRAEKFSLMIQGLQPLNFKDWVANGFPESTDEDSIISDTEQFFNY